MQLFIGARDQFRLWWFARILHDYVFAPNGYNIWTIRGGGGGEERSTRPRRPVSLLLRNFSNDWSLDDLLLLFGIRLFKVRVERSF